MKTFVLGVAAAALVGGWAAAAQTAPSDPRQDHAARPAPPSTAAPRADPGARGPGAGRPPAAPGVSGAARAGVGPERGAWRGGRAGVGAGAERQPWGGREGFGAGADRAPQPGSNAGRFAFGQGGQPNASRPGDSRSGFDRNRRNDGAPGGQAGPMDRRDGRNLDRADGERFGRTYGVPGDADGRRSGRGDDRGSGFDGRSHVRDGGGWNGRRDGVFDGRYGRAGQGRAFTYRGVRRPAFHVAPFAFPRGYGYRRYDRGGRLPFLFIAPRYYIEDYSSFYLSPPPVYFERWIRYGPDALLVDTRTGEVIDVAYGVFYDGSTYDDGYSSDGYPSDGYDDGRGYGGGTDGYDPAAQPYGDDPYAR